MSPYDPCTSGSVIYAYVGNDPTDHTDPTGEIIDTLADIAFIAVDVADIAKNGLTLESGLALGADVVGAAVPFATGGGLAVRGLFKGAEAINHAKEATRVVGRGTRNPAIREAAEAGKKAHKEWKPGEGYKKEVTLENGQRADAVNFETREVKELKPDNPSAIKKGEKQVEGYRQQLEKQTGEKWTCSVETYSCKK